MSRSRLQSAVVKVGNVKPRVYLALQIYALVDRKGSGKADYGYVLVPGLASMPNGIAWYKGSLFIASLSPYQSCTLYRVDNVDQLALARKVGMPPRLHGQLPVRSGPGRNQPPQAYLCYGPSTRTRRPGPTSIPPFCCLVLAAQPCWLRSWQQHAPHLPIGTPFPPCAYAERSAL